MSTLISRFNLFSFYAVIHLMDAFKWSECSPNDEFSESPLPDQDIVNSTQFGVAFSLMTDCGELPTEIWLGEKFYGDGKAKLMTVVPFFVGNEGVTVTDLVNFVEVHIDEGSYAVMYETGYDDSDIHYNERGEEHSVDTWCRFTFVSAEKIDFQALLEDPKKFREDLEASCSPKQV